MRTTPRRCRPLPLLLAAALLACNPHGAPIPDHERPPRELLGLSECGVHGSQALSVEPGEAVTILVHGCNSSAAKFGTLAEVFSLHGQRALCFSYDYRDSLESSALELKRSLQSLQSQLRPSNVTVIAHSQGGLVARAALRKSTAASRVDSVSRLVTISTPFAGIDSSSHCGLTGLHIASLGITVGVCQAIAGRKWTEIYPGSPFITEPGELADSVSSHLLVVTDEKDACLRSSQGKCVESDFVFTLHEQEAQQVMGKNATSFRVKAGHVEIVGETGLPPYKLIEVLQDHQILNPSSAMESEALSLQIAALY